MPYVPNAKYRNLVNREVANQIAPPAYGDQAFADTLAALFEIGVCADTLSPERLEFPVSRRTKVEIKFHGPAGEDEWDALLAHIAFYKTWFKGSDTPAPLRKDELVAAIMEAVKRLKSAEHTA